MSAAVTPAAVPADPIPEPIPHRSDVQKYIRFAVLDRVAHVGMVLEKIMRQNRRAEGYEMLAATGDMKYLTDAASTNEDDMSVNIGNETHYHYSGPPAPAQQPASNGSGTTTPTTEKPPADDETDGNDDTEPPSKPDTPSKPSVDSTTDTTNTNTSTTTTVEKIGNGLRSFVVPMLLGAGAVGAGAGGMALYHYATDKPSSVTTISQPGRFEYRYGIEQRPTPTQ